MWRIVANKVGTGFTPVACKERAIELQLPNLPPSEMVPGPGHGHGHGPGPGPGSL